jgi:septum formation protein
LILASSSPRRAALLEQSGLSFEILPAAAEEHAPGSLAPRELAMENARLKARVVARQHPGRVVLGADTIVVLGEQVFGKPKDWEEAHAMLSQLAGKVHEVLTAVCLCQCPAVEGDLPMEDGGEVGEALDGQAVLCEFVESTRVRFRAFGEVEIFAYFQTVNPMDKAGGYAAQEDGGRLIEMMEGSSENVIGLPVKRVLAALRKHFSAVVALPEGC